MNDSMPPAAAKSGAGQTPAAGIRLLVLDVDGTVTNHRHEVADATCAAIARVRAAGVRVMIATGRRYRDALPIAERLGLDMPLVTASGALVKSPLGHRTLTRAEFAPGVVEAIVAAVVAAGHEPVLYTDSFAAGFDFHCRTLELDAVAAAGRVPRAVMPALGLQEYFIRNAAVAAVQPNLHVAVPAGVFAGFTMGAREQMQALAARLQERLPGRLSLHTMLSQRYDAWLCEIAPVGVTKWTGVSEIASQLGIRPEAICAVGDDVNDLSMIEAAGLGVAMGNARPEVQAAADRVVGTNDEFGVCDVVEMILAGLAQSAAATGREGGPA
jgi:hydroxymethylpyrimidine pyrophosphatase-like HAD family hydrolase